MGGHELQTIEYLQGVSIVDYVNALSDILLWHAVMMLAQSHIAVTQYGDGLARLHLVAHGGKLFQVVRLYVLEQLVPRLPASGQLASIERFKRLEYGVTK